MSENVLKVPAPTNGRSSVDLSCNCHSTLDFGRLSVAYVNSDVLPGDDIKIKLDGFLRGAPMPVPTFGDVDVDVRFFFVPHRVSTFKPSDVVGTNNFSWDNFILGKSTNTHPYVTLEQLRQRVRPSMGNGIYVGDVFERDLRRLYGELGFPLRVVRSDDSPGTDYGLVAMRYNLWSLAAYQRVWWDYYRDSNLIDESLIRDYVPSLSSGTQAQSIINALAMPRYACFRKDYFTTAKSQAQDGLPSVAPSGLYEGSQLVYGQSAPNPNNVLSQADNTGLPSYFADISPYISENYSAMPIQWLRAADSLQRYLERNNLAGSRLMERFLARFGVSPSSLALDMSEYIGGSRSRLQIGDVTANNDISSFEDLESSNAFNVSSTNNSIMGQLAGKCAADCTSGYVSYHAKEFGTIIGIVTLVPHIEYVSGYHRSNSRGTFNDRFDYFTPEFENVGYQPVFTREVHSDFVSGSSDYNFVFGFAPRYSDYKVKFDVVAGDLTLPGTYVGMSSYHLGRLFESESVSNVLLNPSFTQISPSARHGLDRIFSIQGEVGEYDHFVCVYHTEAKFQRNMSNFALPSLTAGDSGHTVDIQNGGVRM